jgi:hypothetical protein
MLKGNFQKDQLLIVLICLIAKILKCGLTMFNSTTVVTLTRYYYHIKVAHIHTLTVACLFSHTHSDIYIESGYYPKCTLKYKST